ncbi:sigma D regulator [Teredinibacter sp. KSP-S5-2]|uniref:sigma D regulator n=1 Tax=Teredinibacter sp. KSP-S5-2 TaxID=3034506 RepID=UPI002934EFA4|nr:sigma D regulator [Teredinibacter sp. KSP-S5-2]WNO08986.1 sigma D regulator [Teredinibacter sp. KSP-S5-2]
MLDNCKTAQERWGGVSEIIDRWLEERQQMLVLFCALSEILEDEENEQRAPKLKSMCEIMVDYTSAGHFEVYDQLVKEGREFDDTEGLKEASELFKTIDSTTEEILDFNDKYQETDDLDTIGVDLSKLGEVLASRFEAEDRMIEVLHIANKDKVV